MRICVEMGSLTWRLPGRWIGLASFERMRNTSSMIRVFRIFASSCALMLMLLPARAEDRLTVFAAASLKGALDEALLLSDHDVTVSYGGSGMIARQVREGAPADLVILASQDWMDWLASTEQPKIMVDNNFLGNQLVLIGQQGADDLPEMTEAAVLVRLDGGRLAIGHTKGVPAGVYGRQWMTSVGLWEGLRPHLAETDNVRATLALVARGEAPLGVVYASDALAEARVKVLYLIPPDSHDPIAYPLAVIQTKNTVQATDLANFLYSEPAQDVFVEHGFQIQEAAQ